jgi:hypothetical protein
MRRPSWTRASIFLTSKISLKKSLEGRWWNPILEGKHSALMCPSKALNPL